MRVRNAAPMVMPATGAWSGSSWRYSRAVRQQADFLGASAQKDRYRDGREHSKSRHAQVGLPPATLIDEKLSERRADEGAQSGAGTRQSEGESALAVKPVCDHARVGYRHRGYTNDSGQHVKRIEMPQGRLDQ